MERRLSQDKRHIETHTCDDSGKATAMKKRSSMTGRGGGSPTTVAGFGNDYGWKDEGYPNEMEKGDSLDISGTSPGRRRKSPCENHSDDECQREGVDASHWEMQRRARISERNRKRGQHVLFIVILSAVSLIILMDEEMPLANMLERRLTAVPPSTTTTDPWHPIYRSQFHSSSFNGLTCPPSVSDSTEELSSPVAALNLQNIVNQYGRYHHNEFQSPYAAPEIHDTDAQKEQRVFLDKLEAIREQWGAWDFRDEYMSQHDGQPRPLVTEFATTPYRDVPAQSFPHDSWQTDGNYVRQLIREGLALVRRVKLGVYSEFDHPNLPRRTFWKPFWPFRRPLSAAQRKERDYVFRVRHDYDEEVAPEDGIAELSKASWDGLVRKLLHALVTNDDFYVVVAGHGSTAGYGNNFDQSHMMVFHRLMEPVFDKLGVRLVSRNMAIGEGTSGKDKGSKSGGTIPSALGGTDIFGPSDILWWDGADADMDLGPTQDFFHRQAILSAKDRIPLLLSSFSGSISQMTNNLALTGHFVVHTAPPFLPKTTSVRQAKHLPFATQFLFCNRPRDPLCTKEHKYNAVCWVNRTDIEPPKAQRREPAGQSQWHSGHKFHHFQGRLLSLVVLQALEAALERWEEGIREEGLPLADKYWHVQEMYQDIENALQDNMKPTKGKKKKKKQKTDEEEEEEEEEVARQSKIRCENLFPPSLQRLCHVPLRAYTDWTPRAVPQATSLLSIVRRSPVTNYKPKLGLYSEYYGPDVVSPKQRLPNDAIDVHAVALVTTEGASPFAARPRCEDDGIPFHVRGEGEKARMRRKQRQGRMGKHRSLSLEEESSDQDFLEKTGEEDTNDRSSEQDVNENERPKDDIQEVDLNEDEEKMAGDENNANDLEVEKDAAQDERDENSNGVDANSLEVEDTENILSLEKMTDKGDTEEDDKEKGEAATTEGDGTDDAQSEIRKEKDWSEEKEPPKNLSSVEETPTENEESASDDNVSTTLGEESEDGNSTFGAVGDENGSSDVETVEKDMTVVDDTRDDVGKTELEDNDSLEEEEKNNSADYDSEDLTSSNLSDEAGESIAAAAESADKSAREAADSDQGVTPSIAGGHGWSLQDAFVGFCDGSSNAECNRHRGKTCLMAGFNDSRGGLVGDALSGWLVMDVPEVQRGLIVVRLDYGGRLVGSNRRTRGWTELNDGLYSDEGVATEKFLLLNDSGDDDAVAEVPSLDEGASTESADDDMTRRLVDSEDADTEMDLNATDTEEDEGGDDDDLALDADLPEDFSLDFAINGKLETWNKEEFLARVVKIRRTLKLWILLNEEEFEASTVEVALRVRSAEGRNAVIKLSHLYYS